jgi:hypothetical protein
VNLPSRVMVEVEPLSEARWARIERDLFATLDEHPLPEPVLARSAPRVPRGRHSLAWAWAGTAAAAAAVVLAIFYPRGAPLNDRLRLVTTDSTSQFTVGESSLKVAPKSLVMVSGDDEHGVDVVLDRGKVTCEIAPRMGRPPFRLDSGEVRVRVVGTKFTVTREEAETTVEVEEGAVEVTARGSVTVLHAGERWPAHSQAAASPLPTSVAPPAAPSPDPSDTAAARALAARRARSRHAQATPGDDTDLFPPEADMSDPPASADAPPAPVPPSAQQAFEAAARRERTNPDEAAAGYRRIAASHSAWAQIALFALARLEADRGNRAEAARLLTSYLTRYPHGINADDARELLRRMR